jgi:Tol biopolymer transport system component
MSGFDLSADLAARLDMLVPPELASGDWSDVARRVRRQRRTLRLVLAFALFVVVAAAATATYLVLRGGQPQPKPSPGALTVITGGYGPKTPAMIAEVRPGGRLVPVWRCPATETCAEVTSVAWAPDGRHLAVTLDSIGCGCTANGLHILDLQTGRDIHFASAQAAQLDCFAPGRYSGSFGGVAWSPDSSTLSFVCATGLHLISSDGTNPRRVRAGVKAGFASWSPDGEWITFAGIAGTRCCSIYVMRLVGAGRRRIAVKGTDPAWSPDGRRIAYRAPDGIRFVTPAGVDVTPGGRAIAPRGAPTWSPDGTRLAIGSVRGTFVVPASGGPGRRVTDAGGRGAFGLLRPAWFPAEAGGRSPLTKTCGAC